MATTEADPADRRLRGLLSALTDTATVVVLVLDRGGRIQRANEGFFARARWRRDDIPGRCAHPFFLSLDLDDVLEAAGPSGSGAFWSNHCQVGLLDEKVETLWGRFVRLDDDAVVFIGEPNVTETSDVLERVVSLNERLAETYRRLAFENRHRIQAERQHAEDQIRLERLAELERLDRFKTHLIRHVAHELRTPMTSVSLALDLLEHAVQDLDDPAVDRPLRIVERGIHALGETVEAVVAFARAETGPMGRHTERFDLVAVVRDACGGSETTGRHTNVDFQAPPRLDVRGDRRIVQEAVHAMLENAANAGEAAGTVRVEVIVEDETDHAVVRVVDHGRGFDPARTDELFRPFSRLHVEDTRLGGGLSLAVVRRQVEGIGGRVGASSGGPGQGATFWFALPRADADAPAEAEP